MNALAIRIRNNPYFPLGLAALSIVLVAQIIGLNSQLVTLLPKVQWQIMTGSVLVAIIAFQWGLFFHKLSKNVAAVPRNRQLHKYLGIAFILVFALHADHIGYAWTLVLSLTLGALLVSGLFNREILMYRQQWIYRTWLWVHIALAAILMPLIIMHTMVALAFE